MAMMAVKHFIALSGMMLVAPMQVVDSLAIYEPTGGDGETEPTATRV